MFKWVKYFSAQDLENYKVFASRKRSQLKKEFVVLKVDQNMFTSTLFFNS